MIGRHLFCSVSSRSWALQNEQAVRLKKPKKYFQGRRVDSSSAALLEERGAEPRVKKLIDQPPAPAPALWSGGKNTQQVGPKTPAKNRHRYVPGSSWRLDQDEGWQEVLQAESEDAPVIREPLRPEALLKALLQLTEHPPADQADLFEQLDHQLHVLGPHELVLASQCLQTGESTQIWDHLAESILNSYALFSAEDFVQLGESYARAQVYHQGLLRLLALSVQDVGWKWGAPKPLCYATALPSADRYSLSLVLRHLKTFSQFDYSLDLLSDSVAQALKSDALRPVSALSAPDMLNFLHGLVGCPDLATSQAPAMAYMFGRILGEPLTLSTDFLAKYRQKIQAGDDWVGGRPANENPDMMVFQGNSILFEEVPTPGLSFNLEELLEMGGLLAELADTKLLKLMPKLDSKLAPFFHTHLSVLQELVAVEDQKSGLILRVKAYLFDPEPLKIRCTLQSALGTLRFLGARGFPLLEGLATREFSPADRVCFLEVAHHVEHPSLSEWVDKLLMLVANELPAHSKLMFRTCQLLANIDEMDQPELLFALSASLNENQEFTNLPELLIFGRLLKQAQLKAKKIPHQKKALKWYFQEYLDLLENRLKNRGSLEWMPVPWYYPYAEYQGRLIEVDANGPEFLTYVELMGLLRLENMKASLATQLSILQRELVSHPLFPELQETISF